MQSPWRWRTRLIQGPPGPQGPYLPITAPATPASGFVVYCDVADGKLKAKASTGTVTTLALP